VSSLADHGTGYHVVEGESPEQLGRNLNTAGHLLAGATAFFFLAFVFAYFYLRSLNSGGQWRPPHVDPSLVLGTLVTLAVVAAAVLIRLGLGDQRAGRRPQWRLKCAIALGLGCAAIALQIAEWATQGFGPTDGGYASVYVGWTGLYAVFVLAVVFWLETLLATAIRYRKTERGAPPPPGHASGDPDRLGHDIEDPISLLVAGLETLSFYWAFLAGIGVLTWFVLYIL
jgi:heme/copper-type cytochrome/quinol oxidase subunit 3